MPGPRRFAILFAPLVATPAFTASWWLNEAGPANASLFAAAIASTLPGLAVAWRLTRNPHSGIAGRDMRWMRTHLLAHLLPGAFIAERLFAGGALPLAWWVLALSVFFYSGRRTWSALRAFRPGKMYFVFMRGNSAMLAMTLGLTAVSLIADSPGASLFVERVLTVYIAIHAMLIGVAVGKIDSDLGA